MEGFTFETTVRVRFADTDAQGIAHNSAYVVWFEVARVEYLRTFAGGYQALRDEGIEALVLESPCRYRVPAKFDDVLHVHTRCRDVRGARSATSTRSSATTASCSRRDGRHACVDATTFRPTRIRSGSSTLWRGQSRRLRRRRSAGFFFVFGFFGFGPMPRAPARPRTTSRRCRDRAPCRRVHRRRA